MNMPDSITKKNDETPWQWIKVLVPIYLYINLIYLSDLILRWWCINMVMVVVWLPWTICVRGDSWGKDKCGMYWCGAWWMSKLLLSLFICCFVLWDRLPYGRKILYNRMTMNTMSFALCLHRVDSVSFTQNHPLPSPSVYKLD